MPPMPDGDIDEIAAGVEAGMYRWSEAPAAPVRASVLFSGTAFAAAAEAQTVLADEYGVGVELWSVTSYKALREQAMETERWNRLHPEATPRQSLFEEHLAAGVGPVVAVSDFMRMVPDQVARWCPRPWASLGTDGFGRSDTREALRRHFETDAAHVVVAVLSELARAGQIDAAVVTSAITRFGIDAEHPAPWLIDR